jgi:Na+/H+ antiporter NhaD/arsenite permease-like protein
VDLNSILIVAVFGTVILAIALNLCDMVIAAMLGVSTLLVFGAFSQPDALGAAKSAGGPLALLFGGMVVARTLEPTGLFEHIGTRFLIATRGSGQRFLLGVFVLVAVLCAFLPNATTVILLAPIIIRIARALDVDFVGPMIVTAIISNSAGLLTLIGDPATYLVGSAIGMSFTDYLRKVSLGGILTILVLIPLMPYVLKDVWRPAP